MMEIIGILAGLAFVCFGIAILVRIFVKRPEDAKSSELDQRQSPVGVLLLDIARSPELRVLIDTIEDDQTSLDVKDQHGRTLVYFTHWGGHTPPTLSVGIVRKSSGLEHHKFKAQHFPEVVEWAEGIRGNTRTTVQYVREHLDLLPKQ